MQSALIRMLTPPHQTVVMHGVEQRSNTVMDVPRPHSLPANLLLQKLSRHPLSLLSPRPHSRTSSRFLWLDLQTTWLPLTAKTNSRMFLYWKTICLNISSVWIITSAAIIATAGPFPISSPLLPLLPKYWSIASLHPSLVVGSIFVA